VPAHGHGWALPEVKYEERVNLLNKRSLPCVGAEAFLCLLLKRKKDLTSTSSR